MNDIIFIGIRKHLSIRLGPYNDRNDGFLRSYFSRSKHNFSRNRKVGKVRRIKPAWRTWQPCECEEE